MAIRVTGVPFGVTGAEWSALMQDLMDAPSSTAVLAGLAVTATGTSRTVQVASGRSVQAGTRLSSTATVTLPQLDAPAGNPRIDVVCAQVIWPSVDDADVTDSAGSFVVVKGDAAVNPVAPTVIQTAGVKWQTPLAQVRVNTDSSLVITDVRFGVLGSVALTLSTNWSVPSTTPLMVKKLNGVVYLGGRFLWTASSALSAGDSATFASNVIIPLGYRPSEAKSVWVTSNSADSTPTYCKLIVDADGTWTLYVHTGTVIQNQVLRIVDTSWIGA